MQNTVKIVDHAATAWEAKQASTPEQLLEEVDAKVWRRCQKIEQSSLADTLRDLEYVSPSTNGFAWASFHAYSTHHHLVLRPDDVWFAVLTQLGFYINAHAEELRSFFVSHEDREELHVEGNPPIDFAYLSLKMADAIGRNVKDPQLRDWVMPDFTTTTKHDEVVGAALFMGAMQAYFQYSMGIICGLPSVTLLGTVEDWRKIRARLDRTMDDLGEEAKHFARMLRPILDRMILTLEEPSNPDVKDFWNRIVHRNPVGSGSDYLSGWLTAFCWWNHQGKTRDLEDRWARDAKNELFDGVRYPYVDIDKIPIGYGKVPVTVDNDMGDRYEATMVAGSVGISAFPFDKTAPRPAAQDEQSTPVRDTVQPVSGWWMLRNEPKEVTEARTSEIKELEAIVREQIEGFKRNPDMIDASPEWTRFEELGKRLDEVRRF